MTDDEIEVAQRRSKKFCLEGLQQQLASDLAYDMMVRDREHAQGIMQDDRRVCFECKHLMVQTCMAINVGTKRLEPYRFILQRCDSFSIKGKS
jgi:hypothetical protein